MDRERKRELMWSTADKIGHLVKEFEKDTGEKIKRVVLQRSGKNIQIFLDL